MATDTDIPTNTLTYSLVTPRSGMTINSASGLIAWTPDQTQMGSYTITVQVADNGVPSASDTKTFQLAVVGEQVGGGAQLAIVELTTHLLQINITGQVGSNYELQKTADLKNWDSLLQFKLATSPYAYLDPDTGTNPIRFYRLKLAQ